ncbi:MAG TPA: type I secretion system protein TolC [Novosphingobium sp.]|nr:type I secretion system protein TolC [Novosphingobium sp.]
MKRSLVKYLAGPAPVALALACAGCAVPHRAPAGLHLLPPAAPAPAQPVTPPPAQGPWWHGSGDELLDHLVERGVARAGSLCPAAPHGVKQKLGRRLAGLWHGRQAERAGRAEVEWQHAADHLRLATDIGLAYARARGWQARLALRMAMPAPLRDTAEIARFRREAGLVPALDEGMAGLMVGLNSADIDAALAAYVAAVDDLARLTGEDAAHLRARLDDGAQWAPPLVPPAVVDDGADLARRPDLRVIEARLIERLEHRHVGQAAIDEVTQKALAADVLPVAAQAPAEADEADWTARWAGALARARAELSLNRAALADARLREDQRAALGGAAERALVDARIGYRGGAASFATLYVAEAAALAAREAGVEARGAALMATIRLWAAQGRGEAPRVSAGGACD